jgi:hypothetical protein
MLACLLVDLPLVRADTVVQASPAARMLHAMNPVNWRMPQMPNFRDLLPGQDEKARIKKKKDGLVGEVGKTATNSWNKTKQVLNPQKLNPINYFPASSRTPAASPNEEKKPGFFGSLFGPPPPEEDEETVTDFLKQSRPGL